MCILKLLPFQGVWGIASAFQDAWGVAFAFCIASAILFLFKNYLKIRVVSLSLSNSS